MSAGYEFGSWAIPLPVASALLGAFAALLFALFKSFLDRRQALIDVVRLLRAELSNVERHTKDSWHTLRRATISGYAKEKLEVSQFPEGGLVTLKVKDLLGLPPLLIKDLMTLVVFLRNYNIIGENLKTKVVDDAFDTQLDALRGRLMIAQRWAIDIGSAMTQDLVTGVVRYAETTQTPTMSTRSIEPAKPRTS